jgi:hypothetical protein
MFRLAKGDHLMTALDRVDIPPHIHRVEPWRQEFRGGTIEDRRLREVSVSLPPRIELLHPPIPP